MVESDDIASALRIKLRPGHGLDWREMGKGNKNNRGWKRNLLGQAKEIKKKWNYRKRKKKEKKKKKTQHVYSVRRFSVVSRYFHNIRGPWISVFSIN